MIRKSNGFSLIEVIVVLVVTGILGAIMIPFMSTALTRSHEPLDNLQHSANLSSDMARVVADYRDNPQDLDDFKDMIPDIIDSSKVRIDFNDFITFSPDGNDFNEESWEGSGSRLLKVRLESVANPGEKLSYYFPESTEGQEEELNPADCCLEFHPNGKFCNELDLSECTCIEPNGSFCKKWIRD
jgi:prepilin-type N-terminal cleavage/methylation domain-containing protein